MESMPTELDEVSRKIMQLEIEETALSKEKDEISKQRLADIQKEKAELKTKFDAMKAKWENEKAAIGKVQKLREEIEQTNAQIEQAERSYDLNKVAELRYGKLPELQKELEKEEEISEKSKEDGLLRNKVTDEEIAKIISRWTGIPVTKLMEGEREKILNLDKILHKRVIGQDEAVEKVESITLSRYAIANLAQSTYIMQHWDTDFTLLKTPAETWWQPYSEFGTATRKDNDGYFKTMATTTADKQANFEYVFENNVSGTANATSMYLEYRINLKDVAGTSKDFTDGTFYRFDNKIYTSIEDIMKAYENQGNPFGASTKEELLNELKIVDGKTTATEIELSQFRTNHYIEIFIAGKAYYKTTIDDQWHKEDGRHIIQRNSVYQLNVKNVFSIGSDVPNGEPDTVNPMYYLNVQVTVNPWVLNTQNVDLK